MADRRNESIGASLGRYGEPGPPSLAPRKPLPRVTEKQKAYQRWKPGGYPRVTPQMLGIDPETGMPRGVTVDRLPEDPVQAAVDAAIGGIQTPFVAPTYTQEAIDAAIAAAGGIPPGIEGLPREPGEIELRPPVVDPVQEAVDAAVGGGRDPWEKYLPSDHPFWQSPEFLAYQEKNKDFAELTFLNPYPASDGTIFTDNLGEVGKLYDQWLINQQNQADPGTGLPGEPELTTPIVDPLQGGLPPGTGLPGEPELTTPVVDPTQEAVDAAATGGGVDPTPDIQALIDEWLAGFTIEQEAQDAARQQAIDQAAAMAGQYTLTGPSIGYNPYESGQYASSPYGTAGVPDMGGITTIPVPPAYKAPGTT